MDFTLILAGIQAAIAAAPAVLDIVNKGKALITSLFSAKAITKEQQDAMHLQLDAYAAMMAAGIVPPAWRVEPDPS